MADQSLAGAHSQNPAWVYVPSSWGESYWFYEGIEDRLQRRALALIAAFGTPGGGDKVCFLNDYIVIASPPIRDAEMELCVRSLAEFVRDYTAECQREGDPATLRWVDKIAEWPDLGC